MLDEESRAKAFTVSGYTSMEVLQTFLNELSDACEQGKTKKDFMDNMNDFLQRNGYTGLNPFKADVIFRTNMQTAYNAGHYKSMTDPITMKLRPYWKYTTAGDGQVRETHAMMEGRIYRADDPIWDIWYPPNGFRCRCSVVSLTKAQVERSGVEVSTVGYCCRLIPDGSGNDFPATVMVQDATTQEDCPEDPPSYSFIITPPFM